jgi:hypothetical protein
MQRLAAVCPASDFPLATILTADAFTGTFLYLCMLVNKPAVYFMANIFNKLESWYEFERRFNIALGILEAALALIAGGFFHALILHYSTFNLWMTIIPGIIFLFLFFRSFLGKKFFPLSGLGELKATMDLSDSTKEIERKGLIDGYIEEAIKTLNTNTCNYNTQNIENHLCQQSIAIGLGSVYSPFVVNPQYLLSTPKSKFSVGAYLNFYLRLPENPEEVGPVEDKGVFFLRDDFGFSEIIPNEILTDETVRDASFFIQTQCRNTFIHAKFVHGTFPINDQEYSIITIPIPTVCDDDDTVGVFFIVSEKLSTIPDDMKNVSQIFSRLFTNWLSRYEECMHSRFNRTNGVQLQTAPPQTVIAEDKKEMNGTTMNT